MSTIRIKSIDPEQSTLYANSGFPSVAQKISSDKDKTTTIYRRFDRLSARNLLLLQAELAELEAQQDRNDLEDVKRSRRNEDRIVTAGMNDWKEFVENAELQDQNGCFIHPREKEKLNLAIEIRRKLREDRKPASAVHMIEIPLTQHLQTKHLHYTRISLTLPHRPRELFKLSGTGSSITLMGRKEEKR